MKFKIGEALIYLAALAVFAAALTAIVWIATDSMTATP